MIKELKCKSRNDKEDSVWQQRGEEKFMELKSWSNRKVCEIIYECIHH